MSGCRRFETEALPLLELEEAPGPDLAGHLETCPECMAAAAAFGRLAGELAEMDRDAAPPEGWRRQVRRRIAEREERRRRRTQRWPAVAAGLAAALMAVAVLTFLVPGRRGPEPALASRIEPGTSVLRGSSDDPRTGQPGDVLVLTAGAGAFKHAELRVYRNDRELVLSCQGPPRCERRRGSLSARLELDAVGRYQPLLLLSPRRLPPPSGSVDADYRAARESGASVLLGTETAVR